MAGKANPRGKTPPVEWEAYHDIECGQWQVNDSDQREIIATGIETEENANVLAAAPKILKALKAAYVALSESDEWQNMSEEDVELDREICASIAAAEGRPNHDSSGL